MNNRLGNGYQFMAINLLSSLRTVSSLSVIFLKKYSTTLSTATKAENIKLMENHNNVKKGAFFWIKC